MNYKKLIINSWTVGNAVRSGKMQLFETDENYFLKSISSFLKQLVMKNHLWLGIIKLKSNAKVSRSISLMVLDWSSDGLHWLHFGQKNCPPEFNSLPLNKCHNVTHNALNLMSLT